MRHYSKILILAALSIALPAAAQTPPPAKKPAPSAKAPAAGKSTPFDPALLHPETMRAKAPDTYDVKFVTTAGDFTIKVTRAWAPNGADRFYNLVRHHFYDGAAFFRVLPGFMAQFGLSAYPEVSHAWEQANIKDDPVVQSNARWPDRIRVQHRYSSTMAIINDWTGTDSRPLGRSPRAWMLLISFTEVMAKARREVAVPIRG